MTGDCIAGSDWEKVGKGVTMLVMLEDSAFI